MNTKELLELIVQAMVDNPEEVKISEIETNQSTILELRVAKSDIGKVIGKKGKNVNALRDIIYAVSAKSRKRVTLEVMDR